MSGFSLSRIPELTFGAGKLKLLPGILERYGNRLLMVTGKSSFSQSSQGIHLFNELTEKKYRWSVFTVSNEPSTEIVDSAVEKYRDNLPSAVVAIGGGSVIDAGKAISAMLVSPGKIEHYLEGIGNVIPSGEKIPFIAVPTTAGTGSEATKNAVISRIGKNGFKKSLRHDNYIPDLALIDPELQLSCPAKLTACSGMDAFSQLLESYLSTKANPMTDALALEGIKHVHRSLVQLVKDNLHDIDLRSKMAYAAWLSGITLANAGLGTVHGFASSIGAMFNIPHGVVCGTLMAETNRLTLEKLNKMPGKKHFLKKYALVGKIISGQKGNKTDDYYALAFIDHLKEMTFQLQIPKLSEYGVTPEKYEAIASETSNKNNPENLSKEDLVRILSRSNTID
ncbi:MAG: iron-containing alcohol dehydrogenase [Prolixibacteraceae bacterium]|nr:iron-containing alcohol dehydrogenase [Prolixibacteraceae bacterium]